MNADGSGVVQLTHDGAFDVFPSFSPDGRRIVYTSTVTGDAEIWTMNANGTGKTQLTNAPGEDDVPEYSPDGAKIAFASLRDGNYEIYVMNANGTDQTNLTRDASSDFGPQWAPSGDAIVFDSDRDGNPEIYAMRPDGSVVRNTTQSPANDQLGMVSPDGAAFAYATDEPPPGRVAQDVSPKPPKPRGCIVTWEDVNNPGRTWEQVFLDPSEPDSIVAAGARQRIVCRRDLGEHGEVPPSNPRSFAAESPIDLFALAWQPLHAGNLMVGIIGPDKTSKGKTASYRVRIRSTETGLNEDGVKVTLMLSGGAVVKGLDPVCRKVGKGISCALGSIGPWRKRNLMLKLQDRSAGTISLAASVSGSLPELNASDNRAAKSIKVT